MLVLAVATMLVGVLGALAQNDLNRMLSFLLVSNIGFLLYGLAVFDAAGNPTPLGQRVNEGITFPDGIGVYRPALPV